MSDYDSPQSSKHGLSIYYLTLYGKSLLTPSYVRISQKWDEDLGKVIYQGNAAGRVPELSDHSAILQWPKERWNIGFAKAKKSCGH